MVLPVIFLLLKPERVVALLTIWCYAGGHASFHSRGDYKIFCVDGHVSVPECCDQGLRNPMLVRDGGLQRCASM